MAAKRKIKAQKRVVPNISFNVRSVEEYSMYAKTDSTQNLLFTLSVEGIKHGVAEGKDTADVLSLYGADKHNNVISIPRKEWGPVLKRAIKFFSKLNQYEKCIDCQQLMGSL